LNYSNFSEGLARVFLEGRYGYINKKGKMVIKPKFDWALNFTDGLAPVQITKILKGKVWGYVDKKGKFVIKPKFDGLIAGQFQKGLADVDIKLDKKGQWFGYIDKSGKFLIEPKFNLAGPFNEEGIAEVTLIDYSNNIRRKGYINRKGQYIWEPSR